MAKITAKQQAFVDHYIITSGNGRESARLAGYSGSDNVLSQIANDNLKKPHIIELLDDQQADLKASIGVSKEEKYEWLRTVVVGSLETKYNKEGEPDGLRNPSAAIQAISELNKMDGDHAPAKTENLNVNRNEELTNEELNASITALIKDQAI